MPCSTKILALNGSLEAEVSGTDVMLGGSSLHQIPAWGTPAAQWTGLDILMPEIFVTVTSRSRDLMQLLLGSEAGPRLHLFQSLVLSSF